MSTTSKSPKDILLTALSVGQAKLADYSHRNSPKKFTQPQLFACLVLKTSLGLVIEAWKDYSMIRQISAN
ncbi:MAG: hypothetical protein ACK53V_08670 [Planctomycetota bacterium]